MSHVKKGQVREQEQAESVRGRVAPARIKVLEIRGDTALCRREEEGAKPRLWNIEKLQKHYPIVVEVAPS